MIRHKLELLDSEDVDRLPPLLKSDRVGTYLDSQAVRDKAESEAARVLDDARDEAEAILERARTEAAELTARGYEEGVTGGKAEAAAQMVKLSQMTRSFMVDLERSVVSLVVSSLQEILSEFDDEVLVRNIVAESIRHFERGQRITLEVSEELREKLGARLDELSEYAAIDIDSNASLSGSRCRIGNGRVTIVGDIEAQVAAIEKTLVTRMINARSETTDEG